MDKKESLRLHEDWWGKCRTCRFWNGADRVEGPLLHIRYEPAVCENPRSYMFGKTTWTEGECLQWDSFDVDTALEVIQPDYRSSFTTAKP